MSVTITAEQILGYKRYQAFIDQNTSNEIEADVQGNEFSTGVVFSRVDTGRYIVSKDGGASFNPEKTTVIKGSHAVSAAVYLDQTKVEFEWMGDDLWMRLYDKDGNLCDFGLLNCFIEIRIYA